MNAVRYALAEFAVIREQAAGTDPEACERLVDALQAASRIFVGGAGRTILVLKMFAMRLMQTNHATYLVGEVCTPSIGRGDLLLVGSGSGETGVTLELVRKAAAKGARTALLTANPAGTIAREADMVVAIPPAAPVTAADGPDTVFVKQNQPGNMFETALLLIADGIVSRIMEREGLDDAVVKKNHANLE